MSNSRNEHNDSNQDLHRQKSTKAPMKKEAKAPQVIISESLESLKKVIELDTDSSLLDLSLLEKLNNEATLRYRSMGNELNSLEQTTQSAEDAFNEIITIGSKIGHLEEQVDKLLDVASEIDEWSRELEVKAKRYKK